MSPFEWWWNHARPIGETLKVWAETIAYGSGGVFLIYKVVSGYFITDLSMEVSCERFLRGDQKEDLAVTAVLKKGEKGTVRVHDAKILVTDQYGHLVDEQPLIGIDRLSFTTDDLGRMRIAFDRISEQVPWLSLPPGDETQFAALCHVPAAQPYVVHVVILGRKLWGGKTAQWRASVVSFPKRT